MAARRGQLSAKPSHGRRTAMRERFPKKSPDSRRFDGRRIRHASWFAAALLFALSSASHGAQGGLEVKAGTRQETLSPLSLVTALNETHVRHRVVIISACYSGVFIRPLADPDTLVITAADADHTSFGCINGNDWTYFGDAFFKTYGADAVQVMSENPYRLARDIRGIGFKTADAIAMKLGIEKTAMIRVRAGISFALTEAMDEGHCGLPTDELMPLAEKLLEVPIDLVRAALDLETSEGTVVADSVGEKPCVFLAGLHRAERGIAERLTRLASGTLPWPWIDPSKALPWAEERIGLALAESQVAAIQLALMSKVMVMTGGPGVGKTTIVKAILRILAAK